MNLSFIAAFAALNVSFPGACPGKDGSLILTKRQIKTGDNALLLTAFALAFSPVDPLSGNDGKTTTLLRKKLVRLFSPREPLFRRRCAPLKVSLWRRMSADATVSFILTKRQHPHFAWLVRMFSLRATLSLSRYVLAKRKRIYYKKVRGTTLEKVNLL